MVISPPLQFSDKQGFSIPALYHAVTFKNFRTYPSQQREKFN